MSSFHALNIESDDSSDDEIDNTKEIQIEDALKIYQTALKLHAQGPAHYAGAAEAYKDLFALDIFNYPESKSEYDRIEALQDEDPAAALIGVDPVVAVEGADNAPSTLPQILHLSYKNRGRFYLDSLRAKLKKENARAIDEENNEEQEIQSAARTAIIDFAQALDKDEADQDLWRRTARVGETLGSQRISRFSLEAAAAGDDDGDDLIGFPGLEEEMAMHDLQQLAGRIGDGLAGFAPRPKSLSRVLRQQLELYGFLPSKPSKTLDQVVEQPLDRQVVQAAKSWAGVGQAIRSCAEAILGGAASSTIQIDCLPAESHEENMQEVVTEVAVPVNGEAESAEEERKPVLKQADDGDVAVNDAPAEADAALSTTDNSNTAMTEITLPTRKRTSESADLPENPEGGRVRSKRIKARESILEESGLSKTNGQTRWFDQSQIDIVTQSDKWLFEVVGYHAKELGIDTFEQMQSCRDLAKDETETAIADAEPDSPLRKSRAELYEILKTWTDERAALFMDAPSEDESEQDNRNVGLEAFLEHSKTGGQRLASIPVLNVDTALDELLDKLNHGWLSPLDAACEWVKCLTLPSISTAGKRSGETPYLAFAWPDTVKTTMMQILVAVDEALYRFVLGQVTDFNQSLLQPTSADAQMHSTFEAAAEMAQTVFELHLDGFAAFSNPSSEPSIAVKNMHRARVDRWALLSREALNLQGQADSCSIDDNPLALRHLWTSAFLIELADDTSRNHVLACIEDLRKVVSASKVAPIYLPNNGTMPELSIAALDREVSKLTTMDFFLGIFDKGNKSPVDLIETLEPLLEHYQRLIADDNQGADGNGDSDIVDTEIARYEPPAQMVAFLRKAPSFLHLALWHRLREAYEAIAYPPRVLAIYLQIITIRMQELHDSSYYEKPQAEREEIMLKTIRSVNEILSKMFDIVADTPNAFECIDLKLSRRYSRVLAELTCLLHVVSLYDDYNQINYQTPPPMNPFKWYTVESFNLSSVRLHDMQSRVWVMLYHIMKPGLAEIYDDAATRSASKINILRHIHYAFGTRRLCKAADGLLLNVMKDELLAEDALDPHTTDDLAQVLYDLYDLQCFSAVTARHDHGCESDHLNRTTALQLMDFVIDKVRSVNMKDLQKSDLGKTVEKMHTALGMFKPCAGTSRNRKVLLSFLNAPVQPLQLLRSLSGTIDISTVVVKPEEAIVASKGWYFIKGHLALMRYRTQRAKTAAGDADELPVATGFLLQDLEFSAERWETWYRLAQAYDGLVDEAVLWSAEKIGSNRVEIVQHERNAIHAYSMAVSMAMRAGVLDDAVSSSPESNKDIMTALYTDFGNRIYSSSRAPFDMHGLALKDVPDRYFSGANGQYRGRPFTGMSIEAAWKFAAALYKQAIALNPNAWFNHFMLGKCLWKQAKHADLDDPVPGFQAVLDCFLHAIRATPERKDHNKQEPVLEPICKMVSMVWKIFVEKGLTTASAIKWIETAFADQQQFEAKLPSSDVEEAEFGEYVLEVLKGLRHMDKAHWHHRMVFRAAQIMHAGEYLRPREGVAQTIKEYLFDQHMFSSKTMFLSIWKPEKERFGRHWVYTTRYYEFMLQLIVESRDRDAVILLARRVRKKASEFLDQASMWVKVANAHVLLHRQWLKIAENLHEEVVRDVNAEDFAARAALIDAWCVKPENPDLLLEVLREAVDLKKLNVGLAKVQAIDDLIADCYANIYLQVGPALEKLQAENKALAQTQQESDAADPSSLCAEQQRDAEKSNANALNVPSNLDGATDTTSASQPVAPLQPQPTDAATQQQQQQLQDLSKRAKPISRRDLIRHADGALLKPAGQQGTRGGAREHHHRSREAAAAGAGVRVVIPKALDRVKGIADDSSGAAGTAASSAPGSVHIAQMMSLS